MGWLRDRMQNFQASSPRSGAPFHMKGYGPYAVEKGRFKTPEGISGKPDRGTYSPRLNPAANLKIPPPEAPTPTMGQKIGQAFNTVGQNVGSALNSMGQAFGNKAYGYGQDLAEKASNMKILPEVPTQDLTRGLPKDMAGRMSGYVEGARERNDRIGSKRRVGVENGEGGKMLSNWWSGVKDRLNAKDLTPTSPLYGGDSNTGKKTLPSVREDGTDNRPEKKPATETTKTDGPASPQKFRKNEPLATPAQEGPAKPTEGMEKYREMMGWSPAARQAAADKAGVIEEIRGIDKRFWNPNTRASYGTQVEATTGIGKELEARDYAKEAALALQAQKDAAAQKRTETTAEASKYGADMRAKADGSDMPHMDENVPNAEISQADFDNAMDSIINVPKEEKDTEEDIKLKRARILQNYLKENPALFLEVEKEMRRKNL